MTLHVPLSVIISSGYAKGDILVERSSSASIRMASPTDIQELGVVGPAAYAAEYAYLWDSSAALARQLETFSAAAFNRFMERYDSRIWVAQTDNMIVGFLTMVVGSVDPIKGRASGAEIPRIYLLPGSQGQGIGRQLVESAIERARDEALSYVWLDVMASASQAIDAYVRWGFEELGSNRFSKPVRPNLSEMIVLTKTIS
jgi:ribosomal protein S18 acetylase RimI-like enzyme